MRLSTIRAGAFATVAAIALAACANHSVLPSSQSGLAPTTVGDNPSSFDQASPLAKTPTCPKSPPQYKWIFKGACDGFKITSKGGSFTLGKYNEVTVKGSIGHNTAKGSVPIDLADAFDKNGDILKDQGKAFPAYSGKGTTVLYASASNQTTQTITPISTPHVPVIAYTITDGHGFPGNTCGAAYLAYELNGELKWTTFQGTFHPKDNSVYIFVSLAPEGFKLEPKGKPAYFAFNCYNE
jgi:hypothetical protein